MLTRMIRFSATVCLMAMLAVLTVAMVPVQAQTQTDMKSVVFLGGAYDSPDRAFIGSVGGGTKLTGGLWTLGHAKFGDNGALEGEVAYFVSPYKGLSIGLIAGPGADWIAQQAGMTPISYLTGAGGALLGYNWTKLGIYAGGKYKVTYKDNTAYPAGWRVGVWLAYRV